MSMTTDGPEDPTPTAAKDGQDTDRDLDGAEEERSPLATHPDPSLNPDAELTPDGRSQVEWVRPTDLAARGGAQVLGRARDADLSLRAAIKDAAREQRQMLAQRIAERGDEVAITSTGRSGRAATREGVSR